MMLMAKSVQDFITELAADTAAPRMLGHILDRANTHG